MAADKVGAAPVAWNGLSCSLKRENQRDMHTKAASAAEYTAHPQGVTEDVSKINKLVHKMLIFSDTPEYGLWRFWEDYS